MARRALSEGTHTRLDGADNIATYFGGDGLLHFAAEGEARFGPNGYIDEPESTNLLLSSRVLDVDDANWAGALESAEDCVQNAVGIDGTRIQLGR
jgi:hypothetical protein